MTYHYPDTAILVFCKAPVAGSVKTRLMPDLSAEAAAGAHCILTQHLLLRLLNAKLCPIQLWCSPDITHPFFLSCEQDYAVSLHAQKGSDLGERMHYAISTALKTTSRVLLIGCDSPSLDRDDFEFAIKNLRTEHDIVIAPAEDGGYVMIGMKVPQSSLFLDMTWGHDTVFDDSRERIKRAGLKLIETQRHWDVDTFSDWQRFQHFIGH